MEGCDSLTPRTEPTFMFLFFWISKIIYFMKRLFHLVLYIVWKICWFRRSRRFSAGVADSETISIEENLSPTTKGTRFLWPKRPPPNLGRWNSFLIKKRSSFRILGQCQLDSSFDSNCSKFSRFSKTKRSIFLVLKYLHDLEAFCSAIIHFSIEF